jgi:hypothetical protein
MSRLHINKQYLNPNLTAKKSHEELNRGLKLLNKIDAKIITFFGSHLVTQKNKYYQDCKELSYKLGKIGYAILSGGGTGIMHAANSGAMKAKTHSIGMSAKLLKGEKVENSIFTETLSFRFLFVRRFLMSIKSEALIFYPGGYGTLNELFEYVVLMQTGIVDTVPIICVNKKYWQGLFDWLKNSPLKKELFIHDIKDLNLIHFIDNHQEIIKIINKQ